MLNLKEDDKFYFDSLAADKACNFIQRYLCHYEDRYAGQPFNLLDWQTRIVRDLFGWKRRGDNRRRFRELYLEIAKGNGKSPLITAIAAYLFLADAQEGQHIFSIATDFKQANITFDCAKKMFRASPKIAALEDRGDIEIKQYDILNNRNNSKWSIMSGTAEGKHGFRPNVVCADEAHEWDNRKLYDNVTSNLLKRSEPLMLIATNAGANRSGICWELHERCRRILDGDSEDETLYPVLFAASLKDDPGIEETWAKANPSLGATITADALRLEWIKAKENPALEARFRRLYLSQWIQGSDKWLDMGLWDKAVKPVSTDLRTLPCHLAVDLSLNDDLTAVVAVWIGPDSLYVRCWFYVPRLSAYKYEERDGIPFTEWAKNKHVRIIDQETVDDDAQRRIERFVLKLQKKYNVQTLAYDRYRANTMIARLEKRGLTCIPVKQTFDGIGPATAELERRLKAGTIVLPNNPCLRWQAENVEVIADQFGNIRPVKEAAKGRYAGRRGQKIDGIVALVIALSEVLKNEMRVEADPLKHWSGEIKFI